MVSLEQRRYEMGKPKTKTVGGGAATPVANSWNQFLGQGLSTGSFGGSNVPYNPTATNGQGGVGGTGSARGDLNSYPQGSATPGTGNAFGGAIDQLLKGNGPQFGAAPTLERANYNPNQTNLDLSKFNYSDPNAMNLEQLRQSGFNMGQNQFGTAGGGMMASAGYAGTQATGVPDFFGNMQQLGKVDMNDPAFAALNQKLQQDTALGLANARERFGGNALNSGASLAEAQFNAQANPANILAMQQLNAQMRGLNLADYQGLEQAYQGRLGLGSQSQLGNRGISSNESIANASNATQASIANANLGAQYGQMGIQGQGQILDYLLGSGRLGLDASQGNAQNAYNAFNANNNANQNNNVNAFNQANMANNFNSNIFGQQSANTLGGFNAGQQGQLGAIGNLFNAYGQSNALGTPQSQTVEVQNPWMQGLQALGGIAQGAAGIYGAYKGNQGYGNMGGGGGAPSWSMPQMPGSFGGSGNGGVQGIPSQGIPGQWSRPMYAPQIEQSMPVGGGISRNLMAPQGNLGNPQGGDRSNFMSAQQGGLPQGIDPRAVAANPQGYQNWMQQGGQAAMNNPQMGYGNPKTGMLQEFMGRQNQGFQQPQDPRQAWVQQQNQAGQPFGQQAFNNQSAVMQQLQQNPQLLYQLMQQGGGYNG